MSGKHQRVILPRLLDAVLRLLYLMSIAVLDPAKSITAFVLDFTQAFWQIPIAPEERKFFCAMAKLRGKRRYLAFLRAAQGSKLAPLHWCRLIALVCCLTQSLIPPDAASLLCYVDDPLAGIVGSDDEINCYVAMIILTWEALGFRLAYAKGQVGHTVTWIGGTIACEALGVRVRVKQAIIDEIKADLAKYLAGNIISLKDLHSTVGRINYAAGLLVVLRPFMEPLWAVLNDHRTTNAPTNCVWTSQLRPTLLWFRAFFENEGAQLERFFSLEAYSRRGDVVQIGTDASPYGMGGWITVKGQSSVISVAPSRTTTSKRTASSAAPVTGSNFGSAWRCWWPETYGHRCGNRSA